MTEIVEAKATSGSPLSRAWALIWTGAQAVFGLVVLLVCLAVLAEEPHQGQTRLSTANAVPATESFGSLPGPQDSGRAEPVLTFAQTRSSWTVFYLVDSLAQRDQIEQFESELAGMEAFSGGYSQTERYYRLFFISSKEDEDAAIRAVFKHTLTISATQRIEVFGLRSMLPPGSAATTSHVSLTLPAAKHGRQSIREDKSMKQRCVLLRLSPTNAH